MHTYHKFRFNHFKERKKKERTMRKKKTLNRDNIQLLHKTQNS